jgi:hypothetical protein
MPRRHDKQRAADELGQAAGVTRAIVPSRLFEKPCQLKDVNVLRVMIGNLAGPLHPTSLHRFTPVQRDRLRRKNLASGPVHYGVGPSTRRRRASPRPSR